MWAIMSWAGHCQPFVMREIQDGGWLVEDDQSCVELIRGPVITDVVLI